MHSVLGGQQQLSLKQYIYITERFKLKIFFIIKKKAGSSLTSFGTDTSNSGTLSQSSAVGSAFTQDTRSLKTQLSQGKLFFPSKLPKYFLSFSEC